jgi:hypothetical protein
VNEEKNLSINGERERKRFNRCIVVSDVGVGGIKYEIVGVVTSIDLDPHLNQRKNRPIRSGGRLFGVF